MSEKTDKKKKNTLKGKNYQTLTDESTNKNNRKRDQKVMNSNHSVEEIIQQAQSINPKKERWLSAALTRQRGDVN